MKNYYRVMLGRGSSHASVCFAGNFIGTDFDIQQDLSAALPEDRLTFNHAFIPVWLAANSGKTRIGAGLACGALWTVSKGIRVGDIVLCPDGAGTYRVGEVCSEYSYVPGAVLPHRRAVRWLPVTIARADMSEPLRNSTGSIGTVSDVSRYHDEIERLLGGATQPAVVATDAEVEDAIAFVMEKHLEDFLVANWASTDLGRDYDIYQEDGEFVGQQYPTDTGPLDILAISKDKSQLLVVELKKGRASDAVVGQVLRYMGYVQQELAEPGQSVRGVIIALDDDQRIRRALAVTRHVEFYRYQVSFKLLKV
ncbi:endonuclease NucS domain-containing protein [Andreprevotia chitinilytica]|uniref:endonuclease NucS domain-containing protein n=1 Tax=Andreprevotia chitinilytica TaxID=396808 RepID=UPI0005555842|nr:endonuclease NucS domain-containing protein [Andreprevotia chitinilytica]